MKLNFNLNERRVKKYSNDLRKKGRGWLGKQKGVMLFMFKVFKLKRSNGV